MMLQKLLLAGPVLFLSVNAVAVYDTNATNPTCFLKKSHNIGADEFDYEYDEPSKPFPSLTQCYKNNQRSCCVSAHDAYIESKYSEILSSTCLREFSYLEQYYCLGCNPDQGKWVVDNQYSYAGEGDTPEWNFDMRICTSFMKLLYDPTSDTYNYEKCGLLSDGVGYLPTARFANSSKFIAEIKPPYFEHVNWVPVNDETDANGDAFADDVECVVPNPVRLFYSVANNRRKRWQLMSFVIHLLLFFFSVFVFHLQGETVSADTYECCFSEAPVSIVSTVVSVVAVTGALVAATLD